MALPGYVLDEGWWLVSGNTEMNKNKNEENQNSWVSHNDVRHKRHDSKSEVQTI